MGVEIERKFLVRGDQWRRGVQRQIEMAQGYLSTDAERTIRVRRTSETGYLTIKGRAQGLIRPEFEYEIPGDDARQLLDDFCQGAIIEKQRYEVAVGDHIWEIDVFEGANKGLIVAEVELDRPDEEFEKPAWLGDEVTDQVRYYNARLAEHPFSDWQDRREITEGSNGD